jgi:hypothetical protein
MALSFTLGTLVTRAQQRANSIAGGGPVETPEWKEVISEYFGRAHAAVSNCGARVFETTATLVLSNLALPTDHYQSIGVDLVLDAAGRIRELPELMIQERGLFQGFTGEARAWALVGSALQLFPLPSTGTYKHIYVPQPTDYSTAADATSVDCMTIDGLSFLLWGVASVALHRIESAQQRAMGESEAALGRLKEWAIARSKTLPKRRQITTLGGDRSNILGAWNPASWIYNR